MLIFEERQSTSPYVERVWRCHSRHGGTFLSMPEANIELVFTRLPGLLVATLRGPVARGARVECPPQGEWLAIRFGLGTYLPQLPTAELFDRQDVQLPTIGGDRFWFGGLSWEIPSFDNAEDFVRRLVQAGIVARSPAVDAEALGDERWMSQRSVQRHFRKATGMTPSAHQQIQRARRAAHLLVSGRSILDAAFEAGYYDQAHLTRAAGLLLGATPAGLARERPQLSFSSKTEMA